MTPAILSELQKYFTGQQAYFYSQINMYSFNFVAEIDNYQ